MDIPFLIILVVYLAVMLLISILDLKNTRDFRHFAVAGKDQGTLSVSMTLLATVLGASTTIGITDTVYNIGFPGIWWLAFGALGLLLQSLILSKKVRTLNADTLPHLARIVAGPAAEVLLASIILISWVGVVAGQIVAMNSLVTFATGTTSKWLLFAIALIVILYTVLGGQMSVVKTDRIQLVIILAGVVFTFFWLFGGESGSFGEALSHAELVNDSYPPTNLFTQLFVIGGVYFLGPDILSRNFLSRDTRTAGRSAAIAAGVLILFAFLITMIGMWARLHIAPEDLGGQKTLMYVIGGLPRWLKIVMSLGLLSAILSSTDTCIINAATIGVRDILRKEKVAYVRIGVILIGLAATAIALFGSGNIISILSGAYSIYTPGVIFPLLTAILCYGKYDLRRGVWLGAVITGGVFGILSTFCSGWLAGLGVPGAILSNLTLIGMGLSLVISLLSVRWKERSKAEKSEV